MRQKKLVFCIALLSFLICAVSTVQQVRSIFFWRRGYARFTHVGNPNLPKQFGQHTISVEDAVSRTLDYSEKTEDGVATIVVDGVKQVVVGPFPIHIGQDGLARYPRWISILELADGTTGERSLYIGSRSASDLRPTAFDVTQVGASGPVVRSSLTGAQRAKSFPVFLIVHALSDTSVEPYSFSYFPIPGELIPYTVPWVGLIMSAILAWLKRPSWPTTLFGRRAPR